MTPSQRLLALAGLSYFIGSIPFGLLVGLAKGVDPRKAGSGNIGATNVGRLLGGKFFGIVFTLDLLKSLLPMLAAGVILRHGLGGGTTYDASHYALWLLVGLAAILGHMFSVFLRFQGGKGVATSAGVMVGLYPFYTLPAVLAIVVFVMALMRWRIMSLASILGAVAFPVAYICAALILNWPMTRQQLPLLICAILMAGLVVLRHRANIARLRAGTERPLSRSAGSKVSGTA